MDACINIYIQIQYLLCIPKNGFGIIYQCCNAVFGFIEASLTMDALNPLFILPQDLSSVPHYSKNQSTIPLYF